MHAPVAQAGILARTRRSTNARPVPPGVGSTLGYPVPVPVPVPWPWPLVSPPRRSAMSG